MIRLALPNDEAALMAIASSIDLFEAKELEELQSMLADYFSDFSEGDDGKAFWIVSETEAGAVGAAYCAPERMTNGTWNLLFIGTKPAAQSKGHGTAMVNYIEQRLTKKGAHLLLVETLADFERTRAFYNRCGYKKEAQIRDFYEVGADKVIYRKALRTKT